jgi:glycosyltransferase involved in cell wall biosynthesis
MMEETQPYILWLPSWYPSKLQPYNGDFIQRHARAAALYMNIEVIYVVKDEKGIITKKVKKEVTISGKLKETIIYYYHPESKFTLLSKLLSYLKYVRLYKRTIREQFKIKEKPQLINVVIALKAGIIGRWIKRTFGVEYVLSEHWTIYLKEAVPNFYASPLYNRIVCKKIFRDAKDVSVVSKYLGDRLQEIFDVPNLRVIPNVVDINVFNYSNAVNKNGNRFIHISTLDYQKNPEDIIKAFGIIKEKGFECVLNIIGPHVPYLKELARSCGVA